MEGQKARVTAWFVVRCPRRTCSASTSEWRGRLAVCVNYAVHADEAHTIGAEIATAGGRAIAVAVDVADPLGS